MYAVAVGGAEHPVEGEEFGDVGIQEFGSPEAFWVIEVEDFPLVVTMDSHGGSLHKEVAEASAQRAKALMGQ